MTTQFAYRGADHQPKMANQGVLQNVRMVIPKANVPRVVRHIHVLANPMSTWTALSSKAVWVTMQGVEHVDGPAESFRHLVDDRLRELREIAEEDQIEYREDAERDLVQFLAGAGATEPPAAYLLEDGSLRAKWRNLHGEQVAVSFAGDGFAQMVFFVRRSSGAVARVVGRDTIEGALCQVRSLGVLPLLKR